MDTRTWLAIAALTLVLAGCSREDAATDGGTDAGTGAATGERSSGLPDDNVFSDQVRTLDKAQGVQQTLDGAAVRTRESVERQERP